MKRLLLAAFLFMAGSGYASSDGFLTDAEEQVIPHRLTSKGVLLIDRTGFEQQSLTPALIVEEGEIYGKPYLLIERDGMRAFLTTLDVVYNIQIMGLGSVYKEVFCASSCWDDAFGGAMTGGVTGAAAGGAAGAAVGAGAGAVVAGPPGAAAGGFIGGAAGVVVGGAAGAAGGAIKEYNTCQKDKAELCDDEK